MIAEASAMLPIWMLLSAAFGFLVGDACGDFYRHRKCLEDTNAELHQRLEETRDLHRASAEGRSSSNAASSTISISRLVAVSKGLIQKRPS